MKRDRFQIYYVTRLGNVVSRTEALRIQALERDTDRLRAQADSVPRPRRVAMAGRIRKLKLALD